MTNALDFRLRTKAKTEQQTVQDWPLEGRAMLWDQVVAGAEILHFAA